MQTTNSLAVSWLATRAIRQSFCRDSRTKSSPQVSNSAKARPYMIQAPSSWAESIVSALRAASRRAKLSLLQVCNTVSSDRNRASEPDSQMQFHVTARSCPTALPRQVSSNVSGWSTISTGVESVPGLKGLAPHPTANDINPATISVFMTIQIRPASAEVKGLLSLFGGR